MKHTFMKNKGSFISIIIIIITVISVDLNLSFWKRQPGRIISNDIIEYYAYLPATFIYHDITLKFKEANPEKFSRKVWGLKLENGNYVMKMSMGLSMMYAPFFLAAHTVCVITGMDAGGYSAPYEFSLLLAAAFYLALGLWVLRKILLRYFSDLVTTLTLLGVVLGTNLFYYSSIEAPMSHVFSFCLFAVFVLFTIKWTETPGARYSVVLGLTAGMMVLIRPVNMVILLVFLFWDVVDYTTLKQRIILIIRNYPKLILFIICAFLVWVPQLIYWKYITGSWLYYSYGDEGFFFAKPEIINVLFSYRKGWLLYTPLMAVALAGIFLMFRYMRGKFIAVFVFLLFNLYVVSCWWCWWYGGSYGLRAFIESYAILSIPLAVVINYLNAGRIKRIILYVFIILLVAHNLFQTAQYYYSAIHWDSMTRAAYWDSFGKLHPSARYDGLLKLPDYEHAKNGQKEE